MSDEEELKKQISSAWDYMSDTLGDFGFDPAKSVFSEFDLSLNPLSVVGNAVMKGLRPNSLSKSRKFPAIVLLPFQAPHSDVAGAHVPAGSSEKVQACKAFVPTLHLACLNPFSVTDTILRSALISNFPTFYAETDAMEPLVPGSLIEVSFDNKYDHWSSGIIKEIILARPVEMPDWAVDVPGATELFNNWPAQVAMGIMGALPSWMTTTPGTGAYKRDPSCKGSSVEVDYDKIHSNFECAKDPQFKIFMQALRTHESGNDYCAVNSRTDALGAYQILPANYKYSQFRRWSQWAGESGLTPDQDATERLSVWSDSAENQEYIAAWRQCEYYKEFSGDWLMMAVAWYTSPEQTKAIYKAKKRGSKLDEYRGKNKYGEPLEASYADSVLSLFVDFGGVI